MSRWVDMRVKRIKGSVLEMEGDGIEAPLYASVSDLHAVAAHDLSRGDRLKVLIDSDDYPLEVHDDEPDGGARIWPYPQ